MDRCSWVLTIAALFLGACEPPEPETPFNKAQYERDRKAWITPRRAPAPAVVDDSNDARESDVDDTPTANIDSREEPAPSPPPPPVRAPYNPTAECAASRPARFERRRLREAEANQARVEREGDDKRRAYIEANCTWRIERQPNTSAVDEAGEIHTFATPTMQRLVCPKGAPRGIGAGELFPIAATRGEPARMVRLGGESPARTRRDVDEEQEERTCAWYDQEALAEEHARSAANSKPDAGAGRSPRRK